MNDEAPTTPEDREPEVDAPVQEESAQRPAPARQQRRSAVGPTTLPENGDVHQWTAQQGAMARAAGLVFTFPDWHARKGEEVFAPPPVVERFLAVCRRTGLDPLARQVYCIGRTSKSDPSGVEWSIQTGIDGFLVTAERTGEYRGRDPFEWLTSKREWVDVFIPGVDYDGDHPLAARATVHRAGWERPVVAVAEWGAYAQTTSRNELTSMWKKQGPGQLAKCALALALRTTFPQDLSGVYTDDEQGGVRAAIEADRREELEQRRDWVAEVNRETTLDGLVALKFEMEDRGSGAGPEEFAALLFRRATLLREQTTTPVDADVVPDERPGNAPEAGEAGAGGDETPAPAQRGAAEAPTPQTGAQRVDDDLMMADDPDWTGAPCPVCDFRHDITDHDDDEFTQQQALHQRAQTAAMKVAAQPAGPPRTNQRGFDASAMGKRS